MAQSDETTIRLKSADSLKLYIDDRGPIELSGKTLGNCIDSFIAQSDAPNEGREEIKKAPNQRCSLDGEKVIPCFIMDGDGCIDYSGRCFGCGDKMVMTTDEQNQTEYDAARAYLIKEGLDPDQLAKEGTVFIKAIHEQISLRDQLSIEKEFRGNLLKDISNLSDQLSKEREYYKALRQQNDVILEELKKEREMRKELVVGLRKITSTIPNVNNNIELMMWNIANDLISKASELDKNKET